MTGAVRGTTYALTYKDEGVVVVRILRTDQISVQHTLDVLPFPPEEASIIREDVLDDYTLNIYSLEDGRAKRVDLSKESVGFLTRITALDFIQRLVDNQSSIPTYYEIIDSLLGPPKETIN